MASPSLDTSRSDPFILFQFILCGGNLCIISGIFFFFDHACWQLKGDENEEGEGGGLTGSAACTGVDGFIPLVGAGHREGALVHAIFAAAKHRPARLEGRAAVGMRGSCKKQETETRKLNLGVLFSLKLFEFQT